MPVGCRAGWDTRDISSDDAAALQHTQRVHAGFSGACWREVQASSNEREEGMGCWRETAREKGGGGKGEREGGPLLSLSRAPTALGQCPLRRAEVYGSGHNSSDKTLYCRTLLVKLGFSCAGVKRSYYHYYYARETFTFCKALGQRGTVAKPFLLL